jgi:hypothetical protein
MVWPFGVKTRQDLTRRAALGAIPRRNPAVETSRGADGVLQLTLRRPNTPLARTLALFIAVPRRRTFELDGRGEWLWERFDGKRSVAQLTEAVAGEYQMEPEAARQAVFQYVGMLMRRGLVTVEGRHAKDRSS